MVLESTMICVDNSEWMRNGDFVPSRLQCQQDAVNLVIQCKLRANPENAVGILSMANDVEVLSTMTQENSRLFMKLHQLEPMGKCNFLAAIKVAHLALKHRQNRSHRMRVVLFIGSPIENLESAELNKIAKKFKKEKVDCDVVCFGESDSANSEIMSQFIEILNGRDGNGSNILCVPSGAVLKEAVASSGICRGEDGSAAANVGGGGFEFGVDPEEDPDLALALRVSMEEERARQAAANAAGGGNTAAVAEPMPTIPEPAVLDMDMSQMSEEQQLEWALRMSMQQDAPAPAQSATTTNVPAVENMDVDAQPPSAAAHGEDNLDELINDPELLQQIVNDLPGGNPDSTSKSEDKKKEAK